MSKGWIGLTLLLATVSGTALALDGDSSGVSALNRAFTGNPHDVELVDPLAFVGHDSGLQIFDIADPDDPLPLGHIYLPGPAFDLQPVGDRVYVANGEGGLQIIDVADPSSPALLGALPTYGTRAVAVSGTIAWLAEASNSGVNGLRSIDISDPAAPSELGFSVLAAGARSLALSGALAYVGIGTAAGDPALGLAVVDVSSPASPTQIGFLPTERPVNEVVLAGTTAYLATGFRLDGALLTVDLSAPANPTLLASHRLGDAVTGVSLASGFVYLSVGSLGLVTLDASPPDSLTRLQALPTGRQARAVAALPGLAVLAEASSSGSAGLTVVDSPLPPSQPQIRGSAGFAEAMDAAFQPGLAYLLRREGLHVFDRSNPSSLVRLGSWQPDGADLSALAVDGGLAAVCQGSQLRLVDIGDSLNPVELGSATLPESVCLEPVLAGTRLHVVTPRGLELYEVSNPTSPSHVGNHRTSGRAAQLALDGSLGYLVSGTTLEVLDLGAAGSASVLATLPMPGPVYGVAVSGQLAVLAGLGAYYTVDLADPGSPTLLATLPGGTGFEVVLSGNRALVAAGDSGLQVVDVSAPMSPVVEAWYDTSGSAQRLTVDGSSVLLATQGSQHWVLGCDTCPPACDISSDLQSPTDEVCEGTAVPLDGSASDPGSCPGGVLLYQWLQDGVPIPGATTADYTVPGTQPPGDYLFALEVSCEAEPGCRSVSQKPLRIVPETWPLIEPNSLKLAKLPADTTLSWTILSGSGNSNIHSTLVKAELPGLPTEPTSLVATAAGTSIADSVSPLPGEPILYRVFGAGSCTGQSYEP